MTCSSALMPPWQSVCSKCVVNAVLCVHVSVSSVQATLCLYSFVHNSYTGLFASYFDPKLFLFSQFPVFRSASGRPLRLMRRYLFSPRLWSLSDSVRIFLVLALEVHPWLVALCTLLSFFSLLSGARDESNLFPVSLDPSDLPHLLFTLALFPYCMPNLSS